MLANRRHPNKRGFTLIEILVAITLLVIVLGIIYGTYSSVVMSVERTREAAERLKTMQFIVRGFTQNLAQATEGWSPGSAYRKFSSGGGAPPQGDTGASTPPQQGATQGGSASADRGDMRFPFKGEIDHGRDGVVDTLTFASTAPIIGGAQLPGQIKLCTYRLEKEKSEEDEDEESDTEKKMTDPERDEAKARWLLVLTETPWTATGSGPEQDFTSGADATKKVSKAAEDAGQKPVSRSVVVYGWDLAYFDGKKWLEEWDSQDKGYLPWSVRVRVKIERPENDPYADATTLDPEKDPSVLEVFFTVPSGEGIHDAPPDYVRPNSREAS